MDLSEEPKPPHPSCVLLLEGPEGGWNALAERIVQLGFTPVRAESIAEAERAIAQSPMPVLAALVPAEFADRRLKGALSRLTDACGGRLDFIAVGPPAAKDERRHLRGAGVKLALWEPFEDETLRFQLNRALEKQREPGERSDARVPSRIPCRVLVGERSRHAELYNLSVSGAFVQTPRACMNGAQVRIELRLERGVLTLKSEVIFANVVGNLQRPNLPLGMGVEFFDMSDEEHKAVRDYVAEHLSHLVV